MGKYKGLPLKARGSGGPGLAMRDESTPYALKIGASMGRTAVRAQGTITSLVKFSTVDMRLALSGASLEDLYPLLGIAFPATRAYTTEGHLLHSWTTWRYEKFMEMIGLHLWEILELKVTDDKLVRLRCGVADFDVKDGIMYADALIVDTEITTILGAGSIDLRQETLDLTFNQRTKNTSPLALRNPIHIRGSFADPDIEVDKGVMAARGLGALALGSKHPP